MEPEVKVEILDDSADESLPVQFLGMTGGPVTVKKEPANDLSDDIKALPYKLLDADALKTTMGTVAFLSELTITFEDKLRLKMFRMMALLESVCQNIKTHGVIANWNWTSITTEVNKSVKTHLTVTEVQKKTMVLLEWLVHKDISLVKTWKSDTAREEFLHGVKPPAAQQEDFVVVKAEHDDFHNSTGEISEDVPVPSVKIKTEDNAGEGGSKMVTESMVTGAIPSDLQVMKAGEAPKERFFHNGEELDLDDVLETYSKDTGKSSGDKMKKTANEESESGEEEDEYEGEEKNGEDEIEYKPSDSEEEEMEGSEGDQNGEEEEEEDKEEEEEEKEEEEEEDGDPGSTSLNMLKQALMRKRGQSKVPIQQNLRDAETVIESSAAAGTSSAAAGKHQQNKPSEPTIGGTSLSIKDLSEVERTVLEATVASNIAVFKTTASTVEEREKKMAVWREIAKKVNASSGKTRTPEELVTIWSKKLFVDHVSSKKSLLVNKESDKTVNGTSTNTAFRSLISKSVPDQGDQTQTGSASNKRPQLTTPTASLPVSAFAKALPSSSLKVKGSQFTPDEHEVFVEQLEKFKSVFQGCSGDRSRADTLKEVWQEITDRVNEVNTGPPRSVDELQKKWTLDLIQNNPNKNNPMQQLLNRGRPGRPMISSTGSRTEGTTTIEIVYPALSRLSASASASASATVKPSATVTSAAVGEVADSAPIKIELDNAESDETQILHVIQPDVSSSFATPVQTAVTEANMGTGISPSSSLNSQPEAGTISFQLMDPVTMDVSTVSLPRACVKLQLVDKSVGGGSGDASMAVKEEPDDDTAFSAMQSKVVIEFISAKIQRVKVSGPSIISLVMHDTDWHSLVKLVNVADPSLVHVVANVKSKVNKTIKLMDNLLPRKIGQSSVSADGDGLAVKLTPREKKFIQAQVTQHKSVLLDPNTDGDASQTRVSVWKVITDLLNASYQQSYTWQQVQYAAADILNYLSQTESKKRTHSKSPEPTVTPTKRVKVEKEEDLVSPRWAKGDLVKAKNEDVWYEATIVDIDEDECQAKVHFNGLTRRCDKWVAMTKDFLSHTSRCLVKLPRIPN